MISAQAVPASGARTGRATDSGGFGIGWALLISVAGGLALYAAFPPVGAWPLAVLGPGAARRRADRAEPAGVVRVRAGVRPRAVRAPAVLAGQRGLVRVGRAGRGAGGHLRGARHRPAAAASAALLAGRGGGLVGMRRGGAGPVALRLSLGPPGDEPVGRAGRALGRGGRRAAAQLPGRPDRRHARAGGAVLSRGERSPPDPPCSFSPGGRSPPDPPCSWGDSHPPRPPLGGPAPQTPLAGLAMPSRDPSGPSGRRWPRW